MSDAPNLDDVMETTETPRPDHREHAKMPPRPNDDELAERTELEREEVGSDDAADADD